MVQCTHNSVFILLTVTLCIVSSVTVPPNPCPQIFQYVSRNGVYQGEINLPNDGGSTQTVSVNISLPGLYNSLKWKISLATSLEDIANGRTLKYDVSFPFQNTLPIITEINLNGRVHCRGSTIGLSPGNAVTNAWSSLTNTITKMYYQVQPGIGGNTIIQNVPQNGNQNEASLFTVPVVPTNPFLNMFNQEKPSVSPNFGQFGDTTTQQSNTVKQESRVPTTSSVGDSKNVQCGVANNVQTLVVNGQRTGANEYPWLVAMYFYMDRGDTYQFRCTANLVSDRHVVTAGHCLRYHNANLFDNENIIFVFGRSDLKRWATTRAETRHADKIMVHPDYQERSGHADVAVVSLDSPIIFKNNIRPICLWENDDNLQNVVNHVGTIAGWGKDESGAASVTEARKVEIPVVSQETCLRSNSAYRSLTSEFTFCAGGRDGKGPCTGDSGSGFMMQKNDRFYLRGVVSRALGDTKQCDLNNYIVFCDTAKYANWIKNTIKNM